MSAHASYRAPGIQVTLTKTDAAPQYKVAIGYLRAFITVLVLAHHAALAYHPYAPAPPTSLNAPSRIWTAFPVVDSQRWSGFALLVGFNDVFFMSLMFFLSGLFVWNSLRKKGSGGFMRDRLLRLGAPFVFASALIAPLAYYPSYLQSGDSGLSGFWQQWTSLGNWPAGPAWFVWELLAFDCMAAGLLLLSPKWGDALGRLSANASKRPFVFFGLLLALAAGAYIPMEFAFNSLAWASFGPFFFQTSRIIHYLVYFLIGAGVGAYGIERGLLAADGNLARRWWLWAVAAVLTFIVTTVIVIAAVTAHLGSRSWEAAADIGFVVSCATISFAFLGLFVRFMNTRGKVWDSLTANAYGMYLIHYAFVSWLQYSLLKSQMPGIAKGSIVFVGAVALSWVVTAGLRKIPAVAKVI